MNFQKQTYVSFDFDNTLYDPETDSAIEEMKNLMNDYANKGYGICITTLRGENEIDRIKELFPDIMIYPTNGLSKTIALKKYIPVPIIAHYDDDLNICISLKRFTKINPIWVRSKRLIKDIKKMETLNLA